MNTVVFWKISCHIMLCMGFFFFNLTDFSLMLMFLFNVLLLLQWIFGVMQKRVSLHWCVFLCFFFDPFLFVWLFTCLLAFCFNACLFYNERQRKSGCVFGWWEGSGRHQGNGNCHQDILNEKYIFNKMKKNEKLILKNKDVFRK